MEPVICVGCAGVIDYGGERQVLNFVLLAGETWHMNCLEKHLNDILVPAVKDIFRATTKGSRIDRSPEFIVRVLEQMIDCIWMERCQVCGCTEDDACEEGCHWVELCLCSECAKKEKK